MPRSQPSERAARTDGIITHRFTLDGYAAALDAVAQDDSAHKVVITI